MKSYKSPALLNTVIGKLFLACVIVLLAACSGSNKPSDKEIQTTSSGVVLDGIHSAMKMFVDASVPENFFRIGKFEVTNGVSSENRYEAHIKVEIVHNTNLTDLPAQKQASYRMTYGAFKKGDVADTMEDVHVYRKGDKGWFID